MLSSTGRRVGSTHPRHCGGLSSRLLFCSTCLLGSTRRISTARQLDSSSILLGLWAHLSSSILFGFSAQLRSSVRRIVSAVRRVLNDARLVGSAALLVIYSDRLGAVAWRVGCEAWPKQTHHHLRRQLGLELDPSARRRASTPCGMTGARTPRRRSPAGSPPT